MGTTGRDAVLWLLLFNIAALVLAITLDNQPAGQAFFFVALILALGWFKYTFYDMPQARRKSKELGLEVIDLLPINDWWAKWLVKRKWRAVRAYEIHLRLQSISHRQLIKGMEKDLAYIESNMQGLFLWQTSVAIPHRIRAIIKKYEAENNAFWETGWWPVPRTPLTGKQLKKSKKPQRRGAIFIGGDAPQHE